MSILLSNTTKQIRLNKSIDWVTWLFFVRIRAQNDEIWELIDSNIEIKSISLAKSIESIYQKSDRLKNFNQKTFDFYQSKAMLYKAKLAKYEKQFEAFKKLIQFIQSTIFNSVTILIQDVNAHSQKQLEVLKARLSSSNHAKKIIIETKCWTEVLTKG
jgi:hypothetical protein